MRWIPASERIPKDDSLYHIKIDGETKRMGCFYDGDFRKMCHVVGGAEEWEIPENNFGGVQWLDEQEDDWIAVDGDNYPIDTPIIIEHKHGYDAVRLYQGEWRYCYANEPVRDILLDSILTTAKRYLIASTPQGGDKTIK